MSEKSDVKDSRGCTPIDESNNSLSNLDRNIMEILKNSTVPMSAVAIKEKLDEISIFSRQHIKRRLNYLVQISQVEFVTRDGRTELFTLPDQVLDNWAATSQANLNSRRVYVHLGNTQYSPDNLVRAVVGTDFSPVLNDTLARETINQLTALLLAGSKASDYFDAYSILPVRDFRRPLEATSKKLHNVLNIIDSLLNNLHAKRANIGPHITNSTLDEIMQKLEPFLSDVSAMNRSDTNGNRNANDSAA